MRVGSKVLRWNLDGKTLKIRGGRERTNEAENRQSFKAQFHLSAAVLSLSLPLSGSAVPPPFCQSAEAETIDQKSGFLSSLFLCLLSVPVTEDNDPESAAMSALPVATAAAPPDSCQL